MTQDHSPDALLALADRVEALAGQEIWTRCAGTNGRYEVSTHGRVRRNDGLLLKASIPRHLREYPSVMLRHSGQRKRIAVHRLVALNFLGLPPFAGAEVRHLDGNHVNPRVDNLAWGTKRDNAADRDGHGRTARGPRPARLGKCMGSENGNYRITPAMRDRACALVDAGQTQRMAGLQVGMSQKSVWHALRARPQAMKEQ